MRVRRLLSDFHQGLSAEIRDFSFHNNQARAALGAALAASFAVLLSNALALDRPYWAGITALVVSREAYAASLVKGVLRVIGTVAGCLLALVLTGLCVNNDFAMLGLIFFSSSGAALVAAYREADSYAFFMCGFMVALIALAGLNDPLGTFDFAFYRTVEISLGSVAAVVMSALVNPESPADRARERLERAFADLARGLALFAASSADWDKQEAASLRRRLRANGDGLAALIIQGRAEGVFSPEQAGLASRLRRAAAAGGERLSLLLERAEKRPDALAPLYAGAVREVAERLNGLASAACAWLGQPGSAARDPAPEAAARQALEILATRHEELKETGRLAGRPVRQAFLWSEVMSLAGELVRTAGVSGPASGDGPAKARRPVLESLAARQALCAGLVLVLVPLIWKWFYFPGSVQIAVTAAVVLQPDPVGTWRKGFLRLTGCMTGGALGLFVLGTPAGSLLIPMMTIYFISLFCFSYIEHGDSRCAYVGLQGGIALTLTLIQDFGPSGNLGPPVERLASVLTGLALLIVVNAVLGGDNPRRDFSRRLWDALVCLARAMVREREPGAPGGLGRSGVREALAMAQAHLIAAEACVNAMLWQGGLDASRSARIQDIMADAERALANARRLPELGVEGWGTPDADRAALTGLVLGSSPGDPGPAGQGPDGDGAAGPIERAGLAMAEAQAAGTWPFTAIRDALGDFEEEADRDAGTLRRKAREEGLSPQIRMWAADALTARAGLLRALMDVSARGLEAGDILYEPPVRKRRFAWAGRRPRRLVRPED